MIRAYALLTLAVVAGVAGMSMVYEAAVSGTAQGLMLGGPLLFTGLWWAGKELGRSNLAHRARRTQNLGSRGDVPR